MPQRLGVVNLFHCNCSILHLPMNLGCAVGRLNREIKGFQAFPTARARERSVNHRFLLSLEETRSKNVCKPEG